MTEKVKTVIQCFFCYPLVKSRGQPSRAGFNDTILGQHLSTNPSYLSVMNFKNESCWMVTYGFLCEIILTAIHRHLMANLRSWRQDSNPAARSKTEKSRIQISFSAFSKSVPRRPYKRRFPFIWLIRQDFKLENEIILFFHYFWISFW